MRADILIFCDGGLGNRINALASGLAVARYFGLTYCIHWPINNWCAAPFQKIFANRLNVSSESISQLRGMLDDAVMLLHDEVASNTLGVKFDSAYRFKSIQAFGELTSQKGRTIFYYPAVIPAWVPEELVNKELKFLKFDAFIVKEVKEFIYQTIPGPFYGLHLRRTDLNVGLDDLEVFNIAKTHPEATFFVCSDDPAAERLASGHPNVFHRDKKFQIEKKTVSSSWLAQTKDDDGRLYYGNIQRSEQAVVEGAIDMLILAHSKIIGYSGSTFQKIAQTIGLNAPLLNIKTPKELKFISVKEIEKLLKLKLISYVELKLNINNLIDNEDYDRAAIICEKSLEYFDELEINSIVGYLAKIYILIGRYSHANILLRYLIFINNKDFKARVLLAQSYKLMNRDDVAQLILEEANKYKPENLDPGLLRDMEILSK